MPGGNCALGVSQDLADVPEIRLLGELRSPVVSAVMTDFAADRLEQFTADVDLVRARGDRREIKKPPARPQIVNEILDHLCALRRGKPTEEIGHGHTDAIFVGCGEELTQVLGS